MMIRHSMGIFVAYPVREEVQGILEPYHARVRKVVELAWDEWRAVSGFRTQQKFAPILYPRTVANYVFDAIARYALAEFSGDPSVSIKVEAQTVKFIFKGAVLARFKKGDENGLGQNLPTQAALAFAEVEGTFPNLPPETAKVEFIWLPNEIKTSLGQVLVVARDSDRLLWDYEIERGEPGAGAGTVVPLFPTYPSPPDGSEETSEDDRLVKPKNPDIKKSEEE
jgi:hypothetical protein